VTGLLLLIRLIRQQRRIQATIVIEESTHELEPPAVGESSFGRRDIHSEDLDTIIKPSWDDPAEEHSLSAPAKEPTVETQTPESVLKNRNTIIFTDDDLAKMLRKIGPDS
jgi:hypothetical protein